MILGAALLIVITLRAMSGSGACRIEWGCGTVLHAGTIRTCKQHGDKFL